MEQKITTCRICNNQNFKEVLDLGVQALTGVFMEAQRRVPSGALKLVQCFGPTDMACGLLQLQHQFNSNDIYGPTYGYRSDLNPTIIEHLKTKRDYLVDLINLNAGDVVVDVGSNDGTLLNFFSPNLKRVGIDPLISKFKAGYSCDILTSSQFFSRDVVTSIIQAQKVKLLTSISMFYDVDHPMQFMQDVSNILSDDGVWLFEQSYLPTMIKQNAYDTVCHEHLAYYGLRQIKWMMDRAGLKMIDVGLTDLNGGSFYVTAAKRESLYRECHSKIEMFLKEEEDLCLDQLQEDAGNQRKQLMCLLQHLKSQGKTIIGFGASTKGNVILQYCGITSKELDCIVEVNEEKFGCVTPGSGIPIVSQDELKAINPDYVLVLPWHFKEFILSKRHELFNKHCGIIFPLPEVRVIEGLNVNALSTV